MSAPVWIDGRLLAAAEATVAHDDRGLTVGDGVFETLKVAGGAAFALGPHLRRLRASADAVGIPCPADDEVAGAVDAVIAAAPGDGFLRITVTAGPGPVRGGRRERARLIVARREGAVRTDPTDVVVSRWTRNQHGALAGVKSTSYAENLVALDDAIADGASEAILANTSGELCEGTGSNVFVVLDGRLVTPPRTSGCLAGVTRDLVLGLVDATEATVPIDRLAEATEMFLTSTSREVQPVRAIDGRPLPACPGPHTAGARAAWVRAYG